MARLSEEQYERFVAKIDFPEFPQLCWEWTACKQPAGYGQFWLDGKMMRSHRVAYENWVGLIPAGLEIDHLCRNRSCQNPAHMEPVTTRENNLRGIGFAVMNARKLHCKNGHQFSSENTVLRKGGGRTCRSCRVLWRRRYYLRGKAKLNAQPS